jgi:hypothetical protein
MKWGRFLFLLAACAIVAQADELRLRDGTVILGAYVGGTQKEVYFQHTPAGSDMYPLFMVESLKFNTTPTLTPGAMLHDSGRGSKQAAPQGVAQKPAGGVRTGDTQTWTARIRWMFALFLSPASTAQFAHPAY